jgi:hypothetical protein
MDLTHSSTISSVTQCPVYNVCDSLDWEEVPSDDEYSDVHFDDTLTQNAEIARLTQLLAQRDAELSQKDAELSQLLSQRDAESARNAEKDAEKARKKAEKAAKAAYDEAKVMEKLTGMSIVEIRIAMMSWNKLVAYRQLKAADDARKVELKAAWMAYKEATLIEKVAKAYEPYKEAQKAEILTFKKELKELKEAEKAQKAAEKLAEKEHKAVEKVAEKARKEAKVVEKVAKKVVDTFKCPEDTYMVWMWKGEEYVRDWRNFVWRYKDEEELGDFVGAYNFEKNVIEEAKEPEEIEDAEEAELDRKNAELAQKNAELDRKNAELAQKNAELDRKNAELTQKNAALDRKNTERLQLLFKTYTETYNKGIVLEKAAREAHAAYKVADMEEKEVYACRGAYCNSTAYYAAKMAKLDARSAASKKAKALWNEADAALIAFKKAQAAYFEAGGKEKPKAAKDMIEEPKK